MKRRKSPVKSQQSSTSGQFRVIGGQWRGRKLSFPAVPNLRPTPDRVRETLFNWLQPIAGKRVLDLFAGSGALGFEALSRHGASCTFIESHPQAALSIKQQLQTLQGTGSVLQAALPDAINQLQKEPAFDIVFIDPPYEQQHLEQCLTLLLDYQLIADNGFVYIENASNQPMIELSQHWHIHREKSYGQVHACLLIKKPIE